jgi:hypothetical protein
MNGQPPLRRVTIAMQPGSPDRAMDGEYAASHVECVAADGIHYCTARAHLTVEYGELIWLMQSIGQNGLLTRFTPAGARELGEHLLRFAAAAEARLASQAIAGIDAALAKGAR